MCARRVPWGVAAIALLAPGSKEIVRALPGVTGTRRGSRAAPPGRRSRPQRGTTKTKEREVGLRRKEGERGRIFGGYQTAEGVMGSLAETILRRWERRQGHRTGRLFGKTKRRGAGTRDVKEAKAQAMGDVVGHAGDGMEGGLGRPWSRWRRWAPGWGGGVRDVGRADVGGAADALVSCGQWFSTSCHRCSGRPRRGGTAASVALLPASVGTRNGSRQKAGFRTHQCAEPNPPPTGASADRRSSAQRTCSESSLSVAQMCPLMAGARAVKRR